MEPIYTVAAAIITAVIGYLLSKKKYKPYYEGYKSVVKAIRKATDELGWKETYELADKIVEMLEDNKVTNKEIKEVIEEADDVYDEIVKIYKKYYG